MRGSSTGFYFHNKRSHKNLTAALNCGRSLLSFLVHLLLTRLQPHDGSKTPRLKEQQEKKKNVIKYCEREQEDQDEGGLREEENECVQPDTGGKNTFAGYVANDNAGK